MLARMRIKSFGLIAAAVLVVCAPVAQAADGNPLEKTNGFYVDPDSNPAVWVRDHPTDKPRVDTINSAIATKAGARWFGNWSGDIRTAVDTFTYAADVVDKLPVLVAYNIPGRDCGGHSGGGAGSVDAYKTWISNFADGIGGKPAVVIIEPDALAQLDCLPQAERQTRLDLLRYAATQFAQKAPNTWAYMDGGNATWIPAATMADRLNAVAVSSIRGFAINVSNFHTTAASTTYGNAVGASLQSKYGYAKPFVIDTSRNGNGSNGEWCNPAGRKLGTPSQVGGGADMLLWVKVPGDSDGKCGIGATIPAGTFSPDLAMRLVNGT
jgi:endoglucanase